MYNHKLDCSTEFLYATGRNRNRINCDFETPLSSSHSGLSRRKNISLPVMSRNFVLDGRVDVIRVIACASALPTHPFFPFRPAIVTNAHEAFQIVGKLAFWLFELGRPILNQCLVGCLDTLKLRGAVIAIAHIGVQVQCKSPVFFFDFLLCWELWHSENGVMILSGMII